MRELKHYHPLPKLQSSLMSNWRLIETANMKKWRCRDKTLPEYKLFKIHVVAGSAFECVDPLIKERIKSFKSLGNEDLEVLAIAVLSTHYASPIYVVSTDRPLLQAVKWLAESIKLYIKAVTPRHLLIANS